MQKEVNVGYIERWPSAVGGGALVALGIRRGQYRSPLGIGLLLVAGHLLYRGITGHDRIFRVLGVSTAGKELHMPVPRADGRHVRQKVEQRVTIVRPAKDLYAFWRNFENLPRFMQHLEAVYVTDDQRSHWIARAPAGRSLVWDAEVIHERPNESIAWRSLPGADVSNSGRVRFREAPEGQSTEVEVVFEYEPPARVFGVGVARLFGEEPDQQIASDLRRFKAIMETGEVAMTPEQSAGGR
jgi:uncharacterized membrane protein